MFKFMKSKKGFTLVELMIVVVIMAILVAVAVPIYNAVTENAKKKTCATNRRNIVSQVTNNAMSDPSILATGVASATAASPVTITVVTNDAGDAADEAKLVDNVFKTPKTTFLSFFNSEKQPICPVAGGVITVSVYPTNGSDVSSLNVTADCTGVDHDENADNGGEDL